MAKNNDLVSEVLRFLEREREIFGDFSISRKTASHSTPSSEQAGAKGEKSEASTHMKKGLEKSEEKSEWDSTAGQPPDPSPSSTSSPPSTTPTASPTPAATTSGDPDLESCKTLDELRDLCEAADALHTDLKGTKLVFGVGNPNADLMLIGEAPGFYEDQQGEPFVGKAGQLLNKILEAVQFKREDVYIANILKHRPPDNRDPKPEERKRSLPYLKRQIELIDPKIILCLGRVSATTLLNRDESLRDMRGKFHPFMDRILMVTYHPAALLRNPQWKRPTWEDVQLLRERYDELVGSPES
jgi:uracil-DNA glycosylase